MSRPRIGRDASIVLAAVIFAAVGFAALLWPVSTNDGGAPPAGTVGANATADAAAAPGPGAEAPPAADSALAAAIVRENVFSNDRRPATSRYDVSGMGGMAPGPDPSPPAPAPSEPRTGGGESSPASGVPSLFGIVAEGEGRVALLRLESRAAGARPYHVGDRGGSYRVVSIGDREVVLQGPAGLRTLRLFVPPDASTSP